MNSDTLALVWAIGVLLVYACMAVADVVDSRWKGDGLHGTHDREVRGFGPPAMAPKPSPSGEDDSWPMKL
jgi:hypothetical protein